MLGGMYPTPLLSAREASAGGIRNGFQFDRGTCTPLVQMRTVLRELNAVHAPWEACRWFTLANPWLGQRRPVDVLLFDLSGVLHAANADRLIANGGETETWRS